MEKSIFKKNIHLSQKEKIHVAKLIQDGGTLSDISEWHKVRFGKPIARSKFFRLKSQASSILDDKLQKSTNSYKRKGEEDLSTKSLSTKSTMLNPMDILYILRSRIKSESRSLKL